MILLTFFAGGLVAYLGQVPPNSTGLGDATDLAQVRAEPLRLDGRRFCGEVEVRLLSDTLLILLPPRTAPPPSEDQTVILPHEWPESVPLHEGLYLVEGIIRSDCFDVSVECVPLKRSAYIDVDLAEPRSRWRFNGSPDTFRLVVGGL